MENKDKQVENLFDGAMSLYNTIELDTTGKENTYTNAEDKIKEVLNGEEPVFISEDEPISAAIFQNVNLGYAVCGIKYLEMIANNQNIVITALGYALQKMNEFAKENEGLAYENEVLKHNANLGSEEPSGIEDKELKGISES